MTLTTRMAAVALAMPYFSGDRGADRLERQERDRAKRGVGDARGRPPARALGGEAQRVVFQGLVGDPLIVLASDAVDPLPPCQLPLQTLQRDADPDAMEDYVVILRRNIRDLAYRCGAQSGPR